MLWESYNPILREVSDKFDQPTSEVLKRLKATPLNLETFLGLRVISSQRKELNVGETAVDDTQDPLHSIAGGLPFEA